MLIATIALTIACAMLCGWVVALQIEVFVNRRIIRAFQQSAVIVAQPAEKKRAATPWWLVGALALLPWFSLLLVR